MSQDKMPKVLDDFLNSLTSEDKDEVLKWLDGNPVIELAGKKGLFDAFPSVVEIPPYVPSIRAILQK